MILLSVIAYFVIGLLVAKYEWVNESKQLYNSWLYLAERDRLNFKYHMKKAKSILERTSIVVLFWPAMIIVYVMASLYYVLSYIPKLWFRFLKWYLLYEK